MEEKKKLRVLDLQEITRLVWGRKKLFLKVWGITFVLACLWILPQPRAYETSVMLAPETSDLSASGGSLASLASSFGVNIGSMANADAIYPLLYPDVVSSNDFLVSLFDVKVKTKDGEIETDYLTYLTQYQKVSIWSYPKIWIKEVLEALFPSEDDQPIGAGGKVNPFMLSRKEDKLVESLRGMIRCSVDKKTDVVTLSVCDQDPLICATMADSVRVRLQDFIIDYRTSKARIDVEYYERMKAETFVAYQKSIEVYGRFCDAHRNMILQTMQSKRDELENDMQQKYNTYNVMSTQLDAAKAKVQERTPAFTTLQKASVPTRPSKPKRMIFVAAMLILSTMVTSVVVCKNYLKTFF